MLTFKVQKMAFFKKVCTIFVIIKTETLADIFLPCQLNVFV